MVNVDRRDFLKKSGAVAAGGLLADLGIFEQAAGAARRTNGRPNIVFVLVDEIASRACSRAVCRRRRSSCGGTCRTCSTCGSTA